jgi:probable addiction module antidote protein
MVLRTTPFDPTRLLDSDEAIAEFLTAAFETGDAAYVVHAFGVAARARGMTQIARDAGLPRESLYRALGEDGNAEFATLAEVAHALGLKFSVTPAAE